MKEIIVSASKRLIPGGRIVINVVALENLTTAINALSVQGFTVETTLVNIARSTDINELTRFEPLNPVFVITGIPSSEKSNAR